MPRSLKEINEEIYRCKAQIALTYENETPQNSEEMNITREGFQKQLSKLQDEHDHHVRQIEVINPRVMQTDGSEPLFV